MRHLVGFALGAARFIVEIGAKTHVVEWRPMLDFAGINFLHLAIALFAFSVILMVVVSLLIAPPNEENLGVFATTNESRRSAAHASSGTNVVLTVVLLGAFVALWIVFSPVFFG